MRTKLILSMTAVLLGAAFLNAEDKPAGEAAATPTMPEPTAEHKWLHRFVGEWEMTSECYMEPGQPPKKGTTKESVRALGGYWVVAEGAGEMDGMAMHYVMNLGYDPAKKKYVGTWVDSMTSMLWSYTGTVDSSGKVLVLECEGIFPLMPDKMRKFRDTTEFKTDDIRLFKSEMLGDDGNWITLAKGEAKRKK